MTSTQKRVLIGAGAALALLLVGYVLLAASSGSTARPGTSVAGVDISGLTPDEAAAAVEDALAPVAEKRMKVKVLDSTFRLVPSEAGLGLDADASVAPAFGRTWNPVTLVTNLLGSTTLPAQITVDNEKLAAQVDLMAQAIDNPPVEPVVEVSDGEVTVTPGTPGRAIDREATTTALTTALLEPRAPVVAVVATVEPTITPEQVEAAVAQAEDAMSSPVTVTAGTVTATIPGDAVGRAMSYTVDGGELVPSFDGAVLHKAIATELRPIEVKGRDATFKIKRGKPKVVKSKVGSGVSDEELAAAVSGVIALPAAERAVTVPVGTREPKLTTQEAQALGITEQMSSFTQYFPYAAYRVQNIGQAAERINGTILMPGETFSLNDTIKERTAKNGYTEGFVVGEGGVFAEAMGGGVSTSATAAWTAAFYAGMERVQTVAHSIYISRYKPGLEATVAWGMFDMKFRNDTSHAVLITSGITNGSINVSFWGTKEYDDIEAEYGERTGIVPFTTVYDDSDECLGQSGVDGFTITVDRVFYTDGEEVKREPITTRYKPAPEVICGKDPGDKPGKGDKPKNGQADEAGSDPSPSAKPDDAPASDQPDGEPAEDDVFTNG